MKNEMLRRLAEGAPSAIETFEFSTGRFLAPPAVAEDKRWSVWYQNQLYPLAVLYVTQGKDNPYEGDDRVRQIVEGAGDWLRSSQCADGTWEEAPNGRTMPCWTVYHWLESWALMREHTSKDRCQSWEAGLRKVYGTIAHELRDARVHNIPVWNAMSLCRAADLFNLSEWHEIGENLLARCLKQQNPEGFWNESGPTIHYNTYYLHALGLYLSHGGKLPVREALMRGLQFQMNFVYPDGSIVETLDGRVMYHPGGIEYGFPGYLHFPEGRRFVRWLMAQARKTGVWGSFTPFVYLGPTQPLCTPLLADAFCWGTEGEECAISQEDECWTGKLGDQGLLRREGSWCRVFSALVMESSDNRWRMERQQFFSLFHDDCGVIVGGGNTRGVPEWSPFIVGERYLPDAAQLLDDGVELSYGSTKGLIRIQISESGADVKYGLVSIPKHQQSSAQLKLRLLPGMEFRTGSGRVWTVDASPIDLTTEEAGGWILHNGWQLEMPEGARFRWPVRPFSPYDKSGNATLDEAKGVVRVQLTEARTEGKFSISCDVEEVSRLQTTGAEGGLA